MKKTIIALCAAVLAAPLGIVATAPATAQSITLELGGRHPGFYLNGPRAYYNGHLGYRDRHAGYRYYRGYWFPPTAFEITGSIGNDRYHHRRHEMSNAHVQWCYDRYRSYRAYDNTYQPYHGPRQQCYSPYS